MRTFTVFLLILVCSADLSAQASGGGIAASSSQRVTVHWMHSKVGRDSVQLRAAVVLRGQPRWSQPADSAQARTQRAILDSLADADERAGRPRGLGYAIGNARVWLSLDYRHAAIRFWDTSIPWLAADSLLVIAVDRVDHVGGPPIITRRALPPIARVQARDAHDLSEAISDWQRYLRRTPDVAAVMNERP